MHPTDDSALLRRYVETRSDEAFATLVARHINLVYSVAKRCVGDPHQAEEIAQSVFILLANKAATLRHDRALSSWLFQTTRLTASNFLRSETRRHRRELEAHMQSELNQPGDDLWPRIEPLLDEAVADLSDTDRQAILLRYYEGRSLREVGVALDASEDAAQKRLTRAVEGLREFFAKQGVTAGATGLAGTISANAVQAAPIGLAVKISTAVSLAGTTAFNAATATTANAVAMTLQKSLVAGALKRQYAGRIADGLVINPVANADRDTFRAVTNLLIEFVSERDVKDERVLGGEPEHFLDANLVIVEVRDLRFVAERAGLGLSHGLRLVLLEQCKRLRFVEQGEQSRG